MCPREELKEPTFTALCRPWSKIWQDGVHRCDNYVSPQAHPTSSPTSLGGHAQQTRRGNGPPEGTLGDITPKRSRKHKMPYALESYLSQSVKEEAWNNVFGFYTRGGEDVCENT